MITINLLPESYRTPKASPTQQLIHSPLAAIASSALVVIGLFVVGMVQLRKAQLGRLTMKLQSLQSQKTSVEALSNAVGELQAQKAMFERLTRERQRWTPHLNALSDATPEGVWFTDFLLDQDKGLVLQGAAVGEGGEEMVRIGRLTQELKISPVFMHTFRDIQIEAIKSKQEKEIEVVEFTLTGLLHTTPTGSSSKTPN